MRSGSTAVAYLGQDERRGEIVKRVKRSGEELVVHGLWWIAEAPDNKVAGILKYGGAQVIRLELSADPLAPAKNIGERLQHWRGRLNVILGRSDDQKEIFTVVDALPDSLGDRPRFFANHVLRGQHLADAPTATFSQLSFELEMLEAWAGGPMLGDATPAEEGTGFRSGSLFAFDTERARYEIHWHSCPFWEERQSGVTYTYGVTAAMSEPVTLHGVCGELDKFLSLITLLMGARVRPRRLGVLQQSSAAMDVITSWGSERPPRLTHHDMLVPLHSLGGDAPAVFSKWFSEWSRLSPCIEMFLSASSIRFSSVKFLCLVNGLEAFHRATQDGRILSDDEFTCWREKLTAAVPSDMPEALREKIIANYEFANECSLAAHLKSLLDVLQLSKLEQTQTTRKSFIRLVVTDRNRLTHGSPPKGDLTRVSQDLVLILLRLLLTRIGCKDAISSAVRRFPWSPLAGGLSE